MIDPGGMQSMSIYCDPDSTRWDPHKQRCVAHPLCGENAVFQSAVCRPKNHMDSVMSKVEKYVGSNSALIPNQTGGVAGTPNAGSPIGSSGINPAAFGMINPTPASGSPQVIGSPEGRGDLVANAFNALQRFGHSM